MSPRRLAARLAPVLLVPLLLAGCVSAQERFERAAAHEAEGRYEDAARDYLRVLDADPAHADALARLRAVAPRVVDELLGRAEAQTLAEAYADAVETLDALDGLRRDAARFGVVLPVPDDYDAVRADAVVGAVAVLVRRAEQAEQQGRFDDALDAYALAQARYDLAPEQHRRLDDAQARLYVRWGEADYAAGRYRAAFDRADALLGRFGPDGPLADAARRLQEDAVAAGTLVVAFLPLGTSRSTTQGPSAAFVQAVDEALVYEHWYAPPAFIAAIDPIEVGRELRRSRVEPARLPDRDAAEIGRALAADLVARATVATYERRVEDVEERFETRRSRGDGPADTTHVRRRVALVLEAAAPYRLLDPRTRDVIRRGEAVATADVEVDYRIPYDEYRGLGARALQARDRGALDDDDDAEELEADLADALAARLAERVYDELLRLVDDGY